MNKLNNANYDTAFNDITITYIDINNTLDFFKKWKVTRKYPGR